MRSHDLQGRDGVRHHPSLRIRPLDVVLELPAEFLDRVLDRPGGAVGEPADRRAGHHAHRVADLGEQVEIPQASLAGLDPFEHPQRPARALAARRALTARLVGEEAAGVVQEVDDAHRLVDHDDGRRAQAEAADLAGAGEVERRVELGLGTAAGVVIDETVSIVDFLHNSCRFFAHESCGQCTPCREGTAWSLRMLERIRAGKGRLKDLELLAEIGNTMGMMPGSTICGLADGAAWPIKNAIKKFRSEFEDYIKRSNPSGWMVTDAVPALPIVGAH